MSLPVQGPSGSVSWGSPQTQLGLELCLAQAAPHQLPGASEEWVCHGREFPTPSSTPVLLPVLWITPEYLSSAQLQVGSRGGHNHLCPVTPIWESFQGRWRPWNAEGSSQLGSASGAAPDHSSRPWDGFGKVPGAGGGVDGELRKGGVTNFTWRCPRCGTGGLCWL